MHGAEVLVDEAHATGVFGRRGRGVTELLDVEDKVAVRVGTLSKAIGSVGGFVTRQPRRSIDWLWNRARTQIFSTAAPAAACAAACAALEIIETEPARREKLMSLSHRLREGVLALGLETVPSGIGPIVPVLLRDPRLGRSSSRDGSRSDGFLVGAMRPPSVPAGTSRLRIGVMAIHEHPRRHRLARRLGESGGGRAGGVKSECESSPQTGIAMVYLVDKPATPTRAGFEAEYPFPSHFFDLDGLRYHYVDEGSGPTLLCVHGNPTWSFAWRNLIKALSPRYRVLAVDHIGCGFSDKPQDYPYRLAQHVANLERFVTALDLREITLLGHDWGGAIGMGAAAALPERFSRFVLFNTAAFRSTAQSRCGSPSAVSPSSEHSPSAD